MSYTAQSSTAGPGVFQYHLWEFYCNLEMNKTRPTSKVLELTQTGGFGDLWAEILSINHHWPFPCQFCADFRPGRL